MGTNQNTLYTCMNTLYTCRRVVGTNQNILCTCMNLLETKIHKKERHDIKKGHLKWDKPLNLLHSSQR